MSKLSIVANDRTIDFSVVYIGGGKWGVNMNGQAAGRIVQGITQAWTARVANTADGEAGDDTRIQIAGHDEHDSQMLAAHTVARAYFDRFMTEPALVSL